MAHDLNDTLVFVKVVEQGSFIAAAKSLGLPKTTVSRKVQELETRLGAQLLHRTTRRLGLTEAGSVYYEHCQRIAQELEEAESAVGQLQGGPRGWLRFTVPYSIGIAWISPLLGEFHAQYPDIRLDMHMSNDPVDLISNEIDVALRAGPLPDSTLVARRLAGFRTQVFASPRYIERHGEPLHPDELQHHRIIAVRKHYHAHPTRITWSLSDGTRAVEYPINPLMVANDPSALIGAVLCGEGLTLATDVAAKPYVEAGALRRVLAGWIGPEVDFNAVFPRGRVMSPKVRAFVDFLVERLSSNADYMMVQCPATCSGGKNADAETQEAPALDEAAWEGKRILEAVVG
ncbi:MAG TPA: LysR family transcriptional regulator [Pseudoxanthomonas sp.]|nr:LysR family transcriptional regulator [Pseudoxanthomonas sp.]